MTSLDLELNVALVRVVCDENQINGTLDVSGAIGLNYLSCNKNGIDELKVSENPALEYLYCSENELVELNVDSSTLLKILFCQNNKLESLILPKASTLVGLNCSWNSLTALNLVGNPDLRYIDCSHNNFASLNLENNTVLKCLWCSHNALTELDVSTNTQLWGLNCSYNKLTELDVTQNTELLHLDCMENQLAELDVSKNTKLSGRNGTTSYDFGFAVVDFGEEIYGLRCSSNLLTFLDLTWNVNLTYLECLDSPELQTIAVSPQMLNKLEISLNVSDRAEWTAHDSNKTELAVLDRNNRSFVLSVLPTSLVAKEDLQVITILEVPDGYNTYEYLKLSVFMETKGVANDKNGIKLNANYSKLDPATWTGVTWTEIDGEQRVTAIDWDSVNLCGDLDLANFTELETLLFDANAVTSVDVTGCVSLTELDCSGNKVETLTVADCESLTVLNCADNMLTTLDVTGAPGLQELYCEENQLGKLNGTLTVENNEKLQILHCQNQYDKDDPEKPCTLTSLVLTNCVALTELDCSENALTELNVSPCVVLKDLNCSENKLEKNQLNLTGCVELEFLNCSYNQLTALDISSNKALWELNCEYNQLAGTLNIAWNTELSKLYCNNNQITELNTDSNKALKILYCQSNQIAKLDCTNNAALRYLNCSNNKLTQLNVSKNAELNILQCESNSLTTINLSSSVVLEALLCRNNNLETLTLPQSGKLVLLMFGHNNLTEKEWDFTYYTNLEYLDCSYNGLTSIDVSTCTNLWGLDCCNNALTELNVTKNTELTFLDCGYNKLTELNVTQNRELTGTDGTYALNFKNIGSGLFVDFGKEIYGLACSGNQFETLDLTWNVALRTLDCVDTTTLDTVYIPAEQIERRGYDGLQVKTSSGSRRVTYDGIVIRYDDTSKNVTFSAVVPEFDNQELAALRSFLWLTDTAGNSNWYKLYSSCIEVEVQDPRTWKGISWVQDEKGVYHVSMIMWDISKLAFPQATEKNPLIDPDTGNVYENTKWFSDYVIKKMAYYNEKSDGDVLAGKYTWNEEQGKYIPSDYHFNSHPIVVQLLVKDNVTSDTTLTDAEFQNQKSRYSIYKDMDFYVEIWVRDFDNTDGLVGGSLDFVYDYNVTENASRVSISEISHEGEYSANTTGVVEQGRISNFGGTITGSTGASGQNWSRLGYVGMKADELGKVFFNLETSDDSVNVFAQIGHGKIDWDDIILGNALIEIVDEISYDLDNSNEIDFGDLAYLLASYGGKKNAEADDDRPAYDSICDFNGDGEITNADIAWLLDSWNSDILDVVNYPERINFISSTWNAYSLGIHKDLIEKNNLKPEPVYAAPQEESAMTALASSVEEVKSLDARLTVVNTVSTSSTAAEVPESILTAEAGEDVYVEVWVRSNEASNRGIIGGYVDLEFDSTMLRAEELNHGDIYTIKQCASGTIDNETGLVDDFGGGVLSTDYGCEEWVRLGWVKMKVLGDSVTNITLKPGNSQFACLYGGNISWDAVNLQGITLNDSQSMSVTLSSGQPALNTEISAVVKGSTSGRISYQWYSATSLSGPYTKIKAAVSEKYIPTQADMGKYLRCVVTDAEGQTAECITAGIVTACNAQDVLALRTILDMKGTDGVRNGERLNTSYNANAPETWKGVTWSSPDENGIKHLLKVSWVNADLTGTLDFSECSDLKFVDCRENSNVTVKAAKSVFVAQKSAGKPAEMAAVLTASDSKKDAQQIPEDEQVFNSWSTVGLELWSEFVTKNTVEVSWDSTQFTLATSSAAQDGLKLEVGEISENNGISSCTITLEAENGFTANEANNLLGTLKFKQIKKDSATVEAVKNAVFTVDGKQLVSNIYSVMYDMDGQNGVDIGDLVKFAKLFNEKTSENSNANAADFDGDGTVQIRDLILFAKNYGLKEEDAAKVVFDTKYLEKLSTVEGVQTTAQVTDSVWNDFWKEQEDEEQEQNVQKRMKVNFVWE